MSKVHALPSSQGALVLRLQQSGIAAWVHVCGAVLSPFVLADRLLLSWRRIPLRVYTNVFVIGRKGG